MPRQSANGSGLRTGMPFARPAEVPVPAVAGGVGGGGGLAEVARHAGVSEATVSRVLNDKPGVAAATRQAVLVSLDVLGYDRPSRLRRRRSGLVGLIVPELDNPVFPAFAQVIEPGLAAAGFTPVLCTQVPGGIHEDEYVETLLEHGVSGIINISGLHADTWQPADRYLRLKELGLPLVLVNGHLDELEAHFISTDDMAGVRLAYGHLRQLGHTRIGLAVGPERFVPVQRKTAAFAELAGADADELIAYSLYSVEGGADAAGRLLEVGATAIICASDLMAIGAVRGARARGLAVPDDLSVVGYDDSAFVAFTDPPLTTVRQNVKAMGAAAVRSLVDQIHGIPASGSGLRFEPELVLRGSTGAAPR